MQTFPNLNKLHYLIWMAVFLSQFSLSLHSFWIWRLHLPLNALVWSCHTDLWSKRTRLMLQCGCVRIVKTTFRPSCSWISCDENAGAKNTPSSDTKSNASLVIEPDTPAPRTPKKRCTLLFVCACEAAGGVKVSSPACQTSWGRGSEPLDPGVIAECCLRGIRVCDRSQVGLWHLSNK